MVARLLAADCVDALQLTLVPRLLVGGNTWFPTAFRACLKHSAGRMPGVLAAQTRWGAMRGYCVIAGCVVPQMGECMAEFSPYPARKSWVQWLKNVQKNCGVRMVLMN